MQFRTCLKSSGCVCGKKRQKRSRLDNVSFEASTCEIIGITGVAGNGLTELEDVISGLMKVTSGRIYHNDDDVTGMSAMGLRDIGLSYVPTDRLKRGASLETSVKENMIITSHQIGRASCRERV